MQPNSKVMGSEFRENPLTWESTRCWLERAFTKDRMVSVSIAAAAVGLSALVEYAIHQAVQSWTVSGVGAAVFGLF